MTKTLMIALAAASLTTGSAAYAQQGPRGGDMTRADAEARAAMAFERMDLTGDGVLDAADREARQRERFDAADANGDGHLTFEETQAVREERRERMQDRRAEASEREGPRGARMARRGMPGRAGMMLRRADSDGDGTISRVEFTSAALARFDRADANGDGTVTADERRAVAGDRRGRRGTPGG